jgi:hypothetical protein
MVAPHSDQGQLTHGACTPKVKSSLSISKDYEKESTKARHGIVARVEPMNAYC